MRRVDSNSPDRRFTGFRFQYLIAGVLQGRSQYSSELDIIVDDEHTPFVTRHLPAAMSYKDHENRTDSHANADC